MDVCDVANRISSYAPIIGGSSGGGVYAFIDAVDIQANHGSFTTLTLDGTDFSTGIGDLLDKTQYITTGEGKTTFLSTVDVPNLNITGASLSVPTITSTTLTATNVQTPDETTSMKIGSATKNMISLNPSTTQVGIHTTSPGVPLDITGITRVSAPSTTTSTTQILRAFIPNLAAGTTSEAQIQFGVSNGTRRCGVLAYNYADATTTTLNKISLYNQGTTTPRLDIDSTDITVTGKLKPNGCTTSAVNATAPLITANTEFLIPVTSTNTLACRKFRLHLLDVQSTVTASILVGGPVSYDETASTYVRVVGWGNNATSIRTGNTSGMPYWNANAAPSVSGAITFEYVGTLSSRQIWNVSGLMSSTTGLTYYAYIGGTILMPATNPVLTRISVNGAPFLPGSYANVTYDA